MLCWVRSRQNTALAMLNCATAGAVPCCDTAPRVKGGAHRAYALSFPCARMPARQGRRHQTHHVLGVTQQYQPGACLAPGTSSDGNSHTYGNSHTNSDGNSHTNSRTPQPPSQLLSASISYENCHPILIRILAFAYSYTAAPLATLCPRVSLDAQVPTTADPARYATY